MVRKFKQTMRALLSYIKLPRAAKKEFHKDLLGLSCEDPGIKIAIEESAAWLCRAQDSSISQDGGVARHFSIINGWSASYPETTGYIIPTLLSCAKLFGDSTLRDRAKRMLDWLVSIQLNDGSIYGGIVGNKKSDVPVTFNTGQILLGMASGVREFGKRYRGPMRKAADWLVASQDSDGCWRKYPSTFVKPGEKAYDTHVAWGLFEAERIEPNRHYADSAMANIQWALHLQQENGWFEKCCLTDTSRPLTHTLGYVLRGILEAYRFTKNPDLLKSCMKTADGLLQAIDPEDGFLPGRLYPNWEGAVSWTCLTGNLQIAICWLMLYQYIGNKAYRDAAFATNKYVRQTMKIDKPDEIRGGIKGSFPIYGAYGAYQYLNWACKFFIDSNMLEKCIRKQSKEAINRQC